jgi:hypothetical protein
MGKTEPLYRRAVAQDILEVAVGGMSLIEFGIFRIDDRGVWIDEDIPQRGAWHPAMEIDEPGSLDARSDPSLPFPFTAKQLAAFALSGMGWFVSSAFFGDGPFHYEGEGPWGDCVEQRDEMLGRLPRLANKAREAVLKAREAYDAAAAVVPPPSVGTKTTDGYDKEQLERELERWRRDMCRALLRPPVSNSLLVADCGHTPRHKRVLAPEVHASIITAALVQNGYDPLNLPPRPPGKTYRPKQVAKAAMDKKGAFEKTWQWMLGEKRLVVRP